MSLEGTCESKQHSAPYCTVNTALICARSCFPVDQCEGFEAFVKYSKAGNRFMLLVSVSCPQDGWLKIVFVESLSCVAKEKEPIRSGRSG